jgi:hypothetical protein
MVWQCRKALVTVYGAWRNAALLRRRLTHLHASFATRRARLPRHLDVISCALLSERTFDIALLQGHGSASSSLAGTGITTITKNTNDNNNNNTDKNND